LCEILLCDGSGQQLELALPQLAQIVTDKTNEVRKAAFEMIAKLLKGFSIANLREFEPNLVYLLLAGFGDESEEIRGLVIKSLGEAGENRMKLAVELDEQNLKQFMSDTV
jgi:hypothetical protein